MLFFVRNGKKEGKDGCVVRVYRCCLGFRGGGGGLWFRVGDFL